MAPLQISKKPSLLANKGSDEGGLSVKKQKNIGPKTLKEIELEEREEEAKLHAEFREAQRNELQDYARDGDTEYWFCVAFQTREAKEEFLWKSGMEKFGDKYLAGEEVAAYLGVQIETPPPPMPKKKTRNTNKRLLSLVKKAGE
jgi:hypothetical protein